jgi:hypothetical protein
MYSIIAAIATKLIEGPVIVYQYLYFVNVYFRFSVRLCTVIG